MRDQRSFLKGISYFPEPPERSSHGSGAGGHGGSEKRGGGVGGRLPGISVGLYVLKLFGEAGGLSPIAPYSHTPVLHPGCGHPPPPRWRAEGRYPRGTRRTV